MKQYADRYTYMVQRRPLPPPPPHGYPPYRPSNASCPPGGVGLFTWVVSPPLIPRGMVVGLGLFNPPPSSPPLWCGVVRWWVVGFGFSASPLPVVWW